MLANRIQALRVALTHEQIACLRVSVRLFHSCNCIFIATYRSKKNVKKGSRKQQSYTMKLYPLLFILSLSITPVFAGEIQNAITGIKNNNEREKVAALIKLDRQLVHAKNTKGDQSLHIAAQQDDCEMMRLLFDAGADVNAKGAKGWAPLRFAGAGDSKEVCLILLEKWRTATPL